MKGSLMESFNRRFDSKLDEDFKLIGGLDDYRPWSGAISTFDTIKDAGKLDDLERLLDFEFPDGLTSTQLNDYLWFDANQVLSDLGISDYPKTIKVRVFDIEYDEEEVDVSDRETYPDHIDELEVEIESEDDDIDEKVREAIYSELPIHYFDLEDFKYDEIDEEIEESVNESSKIDDIDADADDKKEKLKKFISRKIDDIDEDKDDKKEKLSESDKPAATSIEDAQKWVDYDMKKYGKISDRTNRLVKKAGFQIVKDTYGDYEVIAGKYDESLNEDANIHKLSKFIEDSIKGLKNGFNGCYYHELGNGLYYVMSLRDKIDYDDDDKLMRSKDGDVVVGKIAVNSDDMQFDFDFDWTMPYYEDGDVFDTETSFYETDLPGEIANQVIADYNHLKNLEIDEKGKILSK